MRISLAMCAALAVLGLSSPVIAAPKPVRVLIVSGGGFHDYPKQREILEAGLKARLNVTVSHIFADPPPERRTRPEIPAFRNPAYGDGYDVIIHNECAADETDPAVLDSLLAPHRKGIPGVNIHCAMHCFRSGAWTKPVMPGAANARWFAFTGIQSTGHGPQNPITVTPTDHVIAKGFKPWVTTNEELYNNLTQFGAIPVLRGVQPDSVPAQWRGPVSVAWTHTYGPKEAKVFSVTLAHNESVMADARYLDLLARGVAWATGHLTKDGDLDARIRPGR